MRRIFMLILTGALALETLAAMDMRLVEDRVFELTNDERVKRGLPALERMAALDDIARIHSVNMVEKGFFSHTDHLRRSPSKRMGEYYPNIIGATGENIAMHFGPDEETVANKLVSAWMKSPGHRANILRKSFTHLGVGCKETDTHVYSTQNFGTPIAELLETDKTVIFGEALPLRFRYLSPTDRERLTIYINFPKRRARYYLPNNRYYTGVAPAEALFADDGTFTIDFVPQKDYGTGAYGISMGFDGSVYETALDFTPSEAAPAAPISAIPPNGEAAVDAAESAAN